MDLAPEVVNHILQFLPRATRDAVYKGLKEVPKLSYEIIYMTDFDSRGDRVEWYLAHGMYEPFFRFPDIDHFMNFYNTPPYIAHGSELRVMTMGDG